MTVHSIHDAVVPLSTVDPSVDDDSDLEVLRDVVGDARVVCFGESAHFTSEFTRLRDRMMRYLVRELGFTTFVLESGLPEGLAVNRWLHGGAGSLPHVARTGISYGFGRCAETHDQLRWMRAWNGTHGQHVSFYGMDVPGWCANPGPGIAACLNRLAAQPGDRKLLADANLGSPIISPDPTDTPGSPPGLFARINELIERAESARDDLARQCARGALRVVEFLDHGLYPGPGRNLRNEAMAENLRWLLDRDRDARFLVGAHNVHLQRSPSFDGTTPIGGLLAPVLGDDLVLIGTTRGSVAVPSMDLAAEPTSRYFLPAETPQPAPDHTLDALLDRDSAEVPFVDLQRVGPDTLASITAMQGAYGLQVELDPREAFDAVIHLKTFTPAHGIPDDPPESVRPRGGSAGNSTPASGPAGGTSNNRKLG